MTIRAVPRARPDIRSGELLALLAGIFRSGRAAGPEAVSEFERAFARYLGTAGAVAFTSCRAAIYFSLIALELRPGDEVILPAYAYAADAEMVAAAGLKPVFADVVLGTANVDPEDAARKITSRTRVIFPTHMNGIPADLDALGALARERGLRLIEDCARACGLRSGGRMVGTRDIGVFSLGYGKNFDILGGGLAVSSDEAFLNRLRGLQSGFRPMPRRSLALRVAKGFVQKAVNEPHLFRFTLLPVLKARKRDGTRRFAGLVQPTTRSAALPAGFRTRLSGPQAAQGLRFLARIEAHNLSRRRNAAALEAALSGFPGLFHFRSPSGSERLYFNLGSGRRAELQRFLYRHGIDAESDSAADLTRSPAFGAAAPGTDYPRARQLDGKVFYLPNHPALSDGDLARIIVLTREFCGREGAERGPG